ncbi:GntR family transcriptional regulator [Piscinibacter sakaiensis]|uniref:Transcriptional regulator, GntR family n=1 Tax=Piscinibacter sakaiensis TaxID=1547922 RepID=A0A0K8P613_PISS1|nr:GntR family transcriptional regulator [Piscinibacter sakaiensis]GAP37635.1 transcriptional regulator, GntR family [Piscinibacter sakaiensis]
MSADEALLHRVMSDALLSARIPPGAPLRELALAEVFGVSRERVRKLLQRLGHERLIDLVPNRGAFAAAPTLEQAREIYEARRILEGGIVGHLASCLDTASAGALEEHLARERAAAEAGDRAASIRLSGDFHLQLAEATGNPLIRRELHHLVSRTSMLVARFEPARAMRCACDEHADILAALRSGDAGRAMRTMTQHLALIETRLRPQREAPAPDALEVIREFWAAAQGAAPARPDAPARARADGARAGSDGAASGDGVATEPRPRRAP